MLRIPVSQKVVAEFSCNSPGLCSKRHSQYKVILKCGSENIFFLVAGTNSTDIFFFIWQHLWVGKCLHLCLRCHALGMHVGSVTWVLSLFFFAIVIMVFADFLMPKGAIYGLKWQEIYFPRSITRLEDVSTMRSPDNTLFPSRGTLSFFHRYKHKCKEWYPLARTDATPQSDSYQV